MKDRALVAALLVVTSVVLGYSIGTGNLLPMAAIVGLIGIAAMARVPTWGFPIVLASVSGFVAVYAWPRVPLAGDGVYVSELLLLAAVAAAIPDLQRRVRNGTIRLDWTFWVVVGLFGLSLLSLGVGMTKGASFRQALLGFRPMIYLLAYIPALVAVATPEREKSTVRFAVLLGTATALASGVQFLLGEDRLVFAIGTFDALVRADPTTGFFRVRPPGLYLVYALAAWAAAAAMWAQTGRLRRAAPFVLAACMMCIALSFNRNMLVGLAVGVAVAFLVARKRGRAAFIVGLVVVTLIVAVLVVGEVQVSQPLVSRFASLLDPNERGAALNDRGYESAMALRAVMQDPVFGVGWGPGYGALATRSVGGVISSFERPWIHNQYLNQWVRTGLAGAALLVALFVGLMVRAGGRIRGPGDADQWLDMALLASIIAFALSSLVDIVIANPNNLTVLMLLAALISSRSRSRAGDSLLIDDGEAM